MSHADATAAPSVRADEVSRYERLAEAWWDASGPFWPLHRLNQLRVAHVLDELARRELPRTGSSESGPLAGVRVLDIGCGGGLLSEALCRAGAQVTGIDVVERNVRIAERHAKDGGLAIDYRHASVEALAEAGERFGLVMNMEVVEHVAEPGTFLARSAELVAPGGVHYVATINRTLRSFVVAIVGAEYVLGWLPRGTHRWRDFVTPREVAVALEGAGLERFSNTGVFVNPLTRRFSLVRDTGVNYMQGWHRASV